MRRRRSALGLGLVLATGACREPEAVVALRTNASLDDVQTWWRKPDLVDAGFAAVDAPEHTWRRGPYDVEIGQGLSGDPEDYGIVRIARTVPGPFCLEVDGERRGCTGGDLDSLAEAYGECALPEEADRRACDIFDVQVADAGLVLRLRGGQRWLHGYALRFFRGCTGDLRPDGGGSFTCRDEAFLLLRGDLIGACATDETDAGLWARCERAELGVTVEVRQVDPDGPPAEVKVTPSPSGCVSVPGGVGAVMGLLVLRRRGRRVVRPAG